MKTAIVIGATGLVGKQLVEILLKDSRFEQVKALVRKSTGISNAKLQEHIVNFDEPEQYKKLLTGDVLYSAMGTTLKTAGSKDKQFKIDYTYQYNTAKMAAANDVKSYVLISAAGASPDSSIFYSKMKGELEREIKKLPFETIHIIRPGMLAGDREQTRTGEIIGGQIMNVLSMIPGLGRLKPIQGKEVAKAMVNATFLRSGGIHSYSLADVFKLAERTA